MKTIEEVKNEFKKTTGYELPIYTYKGELGVIYECDYEHSKCVPEFMPIDEFLGMEQIDYDQVRWVTVGADDCEEGEEITDAPIRNDENEQKLMVDCVWSPVSINKSDEYIRELYIETDRYYNWTSERKRMIDRIEKILKYYYDLLSYDSDDELEELQSKIKKLCKDWDETCNKYEDPKGWAEFESNSIDFKDLIRTVCEDNDFTDIVKRSAIAAITEE